MRTLVVFVLFAVAGAMSAHLPVYRTLPAVQHEEVHDDFGQYALRYVTAEGTVRSERARLVPGPNGHVLITEGEVSYIDRDGKTYVTKYTADLNGFHVEGNHLPQAPKP